MLPHDPLFQTDANPPSPWLQAGTAAAVLGAAGASHRLLLRTDPTYGRYIYNFFSNLEEKSPSGIMRTFGLAELASSYLPEQIHVSSTDLVRGGTLSPLGAHFQRLLGDRIDVLGATEGLSFARQDPGYPYLQLTTDLGGVEKNISMRFTQRGRLSGSSFRYGAPIEPEPIRWPLAGESHQKLWRSYQAIRESQRPKGYQEFVHQIWETGQMEEGATSHFFQPYLARFEDSAATTMRSKIARVGFELLERPQRLLGDVGFGLRNRSYNSLFHIPFMGGESRGIVNEVLSKRALPLYLLAGVALPYLDYKLGHAPSGVAIDLFQKANIARSEATDDIPGLRSVTDFYEKVVPGSQYGPLALPLGGLFAGSLYHYGKVLGDRYSTPQLRESAARIFAREGDEVALRFFNKSSPIAKGLLIGFAAMLPFIPGMLGSRKTADEQRAIYSGEQPVPVRAGRWWDLGSTPWGGSRIKEWRPHWSVLWKTQAEKKSLYGSEDEYWSHHPVLHPLDYLSDPYYLEKRNYEDRPYPITSPAFSNIPLVGPLLAATIGKLVKPPVLMHTDEWDQKSYSLYSTRLEPKGPGAIPAPPAKPEFGLWDSVKQEGVIFADYIGLPGFIGQTLYNDLFPNTDAGKNINLQGSRQMDSTARRYYDLELGAGMFANPSGQPTPFGYSEPFRRFVQREQGLADANEIPNQMPSWLPGDDYFVNFKVGDPYVRISDGFARLPGSGYEALHPELAGLDPEDYPDLTKLAILADVAPYSREFQTYRGRVARAGSEDTATEIEFQKIMRQVHETRQSVIGTDQRRFSESVEEARGTVSRLSTSGVELEQYPGRVFRFSSVGYTAADISAAVLADNNALTKEQVATEVERRQQRLAEFLNDTLAPGTNVSITVPKGSLTHAIDMSAVIRVGGSTVNQELIGQGLGVYRKDLGGAESQAMFSGLGKLLGSAAESMSFTGDESRLNPLRYIPQPFNSKFWQEREPLAQYVEQEVTGARMRRWQRPVHDFLAPYTRGAVRRVTGETSIPADVQHRRDLNTMSDMLEYLRALNLAELDPTNRGRYTSQASRTAVGANQFGSPTFVSASLPERESHYFQRFLPETDPEKRKQILEIVPTETARALTSQWVAQDTAIAEAEGRAVPALGEGGRLYTQEGLQQYAKAETSLDYGDFSRSQEIANFFASRGLNLPGADSALWNPALDYEDVKLKVIQMEGYDAHDFNIFDDRASLLWRKPYVDGAVRELTTGNDRSVEQIRRTVEQLMLAARNRNPDVRVLGAAANRDRANVTIHVDIDEREQMLRDMRRNPENYQ